MGKWKYKWMQMEPRHRAEKPCSERCRCKKQAAKSRRPVCRMSVLGALGSQLRLRFSTGWPTKELVVLSYIIGLYKNGITYLFIIFSRLMKTLKETL